jgi:hypothetical protein
MAKLTRVCVLLVALVVTLDAGLCPVLCLYADSAGHGSSSLPSQGASSSACGACSSGLVAVAADPLGPLTPLTKPATEYLVVLPPLAPAFDIDHPPRLS